MRGARARARARDAAGRIASARPPRAARGSLTPAVAAPLSPSARRRLRDAAAAAARAAARATLARWARAHAVRRRFLDSRAFVREAAARATVRGHAQLLQRAWRRVTADRNGFERRAADRVFERLRRTQAAIVLQCAWRVRDLWPHERLWLQHRAALARRDAQARSHGATRRRGRARAAVEAPAPAPAFAGPPPAPASSSPGAAQRSAVAGTPQTGSPPQTPPSPQPPTPPPHGRPRGELERERGHSLLLLAHQHQPLPVVRGDGIERGRSAGQRPKSARRGVPRPRPSSAAVLGSAAEPAWAAHSRPGSSALGARPSGALGARQAASMAALSRPPSPGAVFASRRLDGVDVRREAPAGRRTTAWRATSASSRRSSGGSGAPLPWAGRASTPPGAMIGMRVASLARALVRPATATTRRNTTDAPASQNLPRLGAAGAGLPPRRSRASLPTGPFAFDKDVPGSIYLRELVAPIERVIFR